MNSKEQVMAARLRIFDRSSIRIYILLFSNIPTANYVFSLVRILTGLDHPCLIPESKKRVFISTKKLPFFYFLKHFYVKLDHLSRFKRLLAELKAKLQVSIWGSPCAHLAS